ncbi:DUF354 domain-containing protein [candidate division KSB1 bacterium]|nr:DUF354 domain-containing protein [candidate division KSB1 bacterium]
MKIMFYLGHPAHFNLFRHVIQSMQENHHSVIILCRKKDVLLDLLNHAGWNHYNILPRGRKNNKFALVTSFMAKFIRMLMISLKIRPDLLIGTSEVIPYIGKLLKKPSIIVNEDDAEAVPYFSRLSYPLATHIIAPAGVSVGKWSHKHIGYNGYHELAYLHPKYFRPNALVLKKYNLSRPFHIIRLARLNAHHDNDNRGISDSIVFELLKLFGTENQILISSERPVDKSLHPLLFKIDAHDMHHLLYFAQLYIGDSQTMAAEAAILGTPSIRFNHFVGKLYYLKELEEKYGLSIGIPDSDPQKLYTTVRFLIKQQPGLKRIWQQRAQRMIREKDDVTEFFLQKITMIYNDSVGTPTVPSFDSRPKYEKESPVPSLQFYYAENKE